MTPTPGRRAPGRAGGQAHLKGRNGGRRRHQHQPNAISLEISHRRISNRYDDLVARSSQTELAVLGALSTGVMTGYEVRAAITQTLGAFWQESFGQIYPTLGRLEASGAIRPADASPDHRPSRAGGTSRRRYAITSAGRAQLRTLLAEPWRPAPPRNGLLLRLFFGTELPEGADRRLLHDVLRETEVALARYAEERSGILNPDTAAQRYRSMTLAYGEQVVAAQRQWAQACLDELERWEQEARPDPGSGRPSDETTADPTSVKARVRRRPHA